MGSKRNDVFVLGDEILAAESTATQDTGSERAGDGWDEDVQAAGLKATAPVTLRTRATSVPRRLAALGLGAGAAAAIAAALLAEGGGHGATSSPSSTSSVSPPPPNAASVSKVVRSPLPVRPHRSHRPHPRIRKAERKPDEHRGKKPVREPTDDEAPASSPAVISTPAPAPTPVAAAPTPPPPPERCFAASERRRRLGWGGGVWFRALAMASAAEKRIVLPAALGGGSQSARAARFRALAPRYLATAALAVLIALGVRSLLSPTPPASPPAPLGADAPSEDFALQFARAYLTYDAEHPGAHTQALAPFLPDGLRRGGGFYATSGEQRVLWTEVASDQPALVGGRAITIAAGVSSQRAPVYLAVTVRHPAGQPLALVGYPSFVGAPLVDVDSGVASGEAVSDSAVVEVVERVIRNYLERSPANLKADLTGDAVVTLPTVALRVQSVVGVVWVGAPGSGAVLITVTAADTRGAIYTLAYELGMAYRERPYVDFIEVIPTAS